MFKPQSIGFVLNPMAGRRKVKHWEREIRVALGPAKIPFEIVLTTRPKEAGKLAAGLAERHELVVAVGGDGTVHEVAQGLIGTSCVLGLIPNGSGNDYNRFLTMPKRIHSAVQALVGSTEILSADVAKVIVREWVDRGDVTRWTINTLGIGYDASVAFRRERVPLLKGLPLYLTSALWTLSDFVPLDFVVKLDRQPARKLKGYMVCLGIGKFEGGGFKVLPDAKHDDGVTEVCEVEAVSRMKLLPLLLKAVVGAHTKSPHVRMDKTVDATVSADRAFSVHADGELISDDAREVRFELHPKALRVARFVSVA